MWCSKTLSKTCVRIFNVLPMDVHRWVKNRFSYYASLPHTREVDNPYHVEPTVPFVGAYEVGLGTILEQTHLYINSTFIP